jgi:hypothetical protein
MLVYDTHLAVLPYRPDASTGAEAVAAAAVASETSLLRYMRRDTCSHVAVPGMSDMVRRGRCVAHAGRRCTRHTQWTCARSTRVYVTCVP